MSDYIHQISGEGGNKPLQEGSNLDDLVSGKYVAKNTGSNTPLKSYILRDAAVNEIYHHFPSLSHVEAAMVLHTVPSADVRENVRGEWIEPNGMLTILCSNCGFINNSAKWNFCPNCGADMRERRTDG